MVIRYRQVQFFAGVCVAAAAKQVLCIRLYGRSTTFPPLGCNHKLLVLINGQAGTRHGELDDEDDEQDDHVEKQHHLVVLAGADETHYGYDEEEHSTRYDARHQGQRRDDGGHLCHRRHAYHDECHNDVQYIKGQKAILGACESPTHLDGGS